MSVRRTDSAGLLERPGVAAGAGADLEDPGALRKLGDEAVHRGPHDVGHLLGAFAVLLGVRVVGRDRDPLGDVGDVVRVVHQVVQVVAGEGVDGEPVAVAAGAAPLPLVPGHGGVLLGDRVGRLDHLARRRPPGPARP